MSRTDKSIETKGRLSVAWSWKWEQDRISEHHKRSLYADENFIKLDSGNGFLAL